MEPFVEQLYQVAKALEDKNCPTMAKKVRLAADEIIRLKNVSQPYMWVGNDAFTEQQVLDLLNENQKMRNLLYETSVWVNGKDADLYNKILDISNQ